MIKAVIFDIGGVLAHDVWEHLLLNSRSDQKPGIASRYHLPRKKAEKVGQQLWNEYECKKLSAGHDWASLESEYWERFIEAFKGELPADVTANTFIQMTDEFICGVNPQAMIPIFERLQSKGVDLAICSNNTEFWYNRQASKLGLETYFREDRIFLSCRIGYAKRSREMFAAVIGGLGVEGETCIFVDDRPENIHRAREWLNMTGILFPREADWGAFYLDSLLRQMGL